MSTKLRVLALMHRHLVPPETIPEGTDLVVLPGGFANVENLVGTEGKGWTYAKYLLGHERTGITGVGASKRELALLKDFAATQLGRE